jgi:hypothetical protein
VLRRNASGMVYHMCYFTSDVNASIAAIEDAKLRPVCLSPSKPSVLFGGMSVSFYQVTGVGVIEIIEGLPRFEP